MFCGQPDGAGRVVTVFNNCSGSIRRTIFKRLNIQRPAVGLRCPVQNVSLEQLRLILEPDWHLWTQTSQRRRKGAAFPEFVAGESDAISGFCSLESPAARNSSATGRARGNLLVYNSGSLGIVMPPLKCIHKVDLYGGLKKKHSLCS